MVGRACWHRSAYRQAETLQARAGNQDVRAFSLLNIARTQLQLDQVAAAHASYRAAERVFAELDAGQLGVGTRALTHGLILLAQAQPAAAAERLQRACARFEATQSLPLLAQCLDALARAQTALGRITQALAAREAQLRVTATIDRNMQREQALLLTGEFQSSQRELDNLRLQRETERQQRQLQEAARHERVRTGLLALMALVLVGILLYQRRTYRRLRVARRDAATDSLTGTASRRHAMDVLQRFMSQWHAQARVFSVLVFDADRFKSINDSHGHAVGDRVLQRVATAARAVLRDSDVLARIGGEEFLVILPGAQLEQAAALAERLRAAVQAVPMDDLASGLGATISIGVAQVAEADRGPEALLARADAALYQAKAEGRNRVVAARR